jgi:hypothetical protein
MGRAHNLKYMHAFENNIKMNLKYKRYEHMNWIYLREISGSHSGEYEVDCLVLCCFV